MAVVNKAYDTLLNREVAIKIIRTENIPPKALEHTLKRFSREGQILQKLDHPNIVKVFDFGESDGQPFLVMEYLPCGTLKQLIKKRKSILWKESLRLLIPILQALEYAHSKGVIHRDIKPSNILLTSDGQPMLSDFGVAKIIEEDATQELTATSASVGTPEYMAPEQITSKTFDARADLYSLGIVFYELITGRRPFEADTPMAVLVKHANDALPRPSLFINNLPKDVELFLIKSLSKDPNHRYQSAAAMLDACNALLAGTPLDIQIDLQPQTKEPRKPRSSRTFSRKWFFIIAGSVLLICLLVYSYLFPPSRSQILPTSTLPPISTAASTALSPPSPSPSATVTIQPSTPTISQPEIVIPEGYPVNCHYIADANGTTIKILDPGKNYPVNGKDTTGNWINIEIDPITDRRGEEVNNCWVASTNEIEVIGEVEGIIDSDSINKVWNATVNLYFGDNCTNQPANCTALFNQVKYYYYTSYDEIEKNVKAQCKIFIPSPTDRMVCQTIFEGPFFTDLWKMDLNTRIVTLQ